MPLCYAADCVTITRYVVKKSLESGEKARNLVGNRPIHPPAWEAGQGGRFGHDSYFGVLGAENALCAPGYQVCYFVGGRGAFCAILTGFSRRSSILANRSVSPQSASPVKLAVADGI